MLPHRYPMLLVDRVLEYQPGQSVKGIKNVTINEAFFQGHYPGNPIMPGVLILEAMAQVGSVILLCDPKFHDRVPLLGGVEHTRFRRPVVPGDQLLISVEMLWFKRDIGRVKGLATVEGETAAETELMFKLVPAST